MNTPSHSSPSRRLFNVLAAAIALPLIALVPAFLASSWITHEAIEPDDPSEHAAAIDVTDIDREGAVVYTIKPRTSDTGPTDANFSTPHSVLKNSDLIILTIQDDEDPGEWLGDGAEDDCSFTLHLSDDDTFDNQSETFTGYIRVTDDDFTAQTDSLESENCGFYLSLDFDE